MIYGSSQLLIFTRAELITFAYVKLYILISLIGHIMQLLLIQVCKFHCLL